MLDAEQRLTPDQHALYEAMSDISEDCWCAGWLIGTEFAIWGALQDGDLKWGMGMIDEADLDRVRALSEKVGGWIRWWELPWTDRGPHFVPMTEWLEICEKRKA